MVCQYFAPLHLSVERDDLQRGLKSKLEHTKLGEIDLIKLDACKQSVHRDHRKIMSESLRQDYLILSLQLSGIGVLEQEGRQVKMQPGEAVLFDTARPYSFSLDGDFKKIVTRIPSDNFKRYFSHPERLCAYKIDSSVPGAQMLFSYISCLNSDADNLSSTSAQSFSTALTEMVSGTLLALPQSQQANGSSVKHYHLNEIKKIIANKLSHPSLGAELLSDELGLSISSIYRIFENESIPLTQFIWNQRLDRCHKDLIDTSLSGRSITDIAFRWGFNSSAHFSRAFKSRFGFTPREWRATPAGSSHEQMHDGANISRHTRLSK